MEIWASVICVSSNKAPLFLVDFLVDALVDIMTNLQNVGKVSISVFQRRFLQNPAFLIKYVFGVST